ncbi:MAG: UPF0262 family protein [Alphaproteobacteria bacterium]|nr:UPF0262 family protein [Alphaproteobacteria bacterium]
MPGSGRIARISLDETSIARRGPEIDRERAVAVRDLLESNRFELAGGHRGPYHLRFFVEENRLMLDILSGGGTGEGRPLQVIGLSLDPFRRVIKDYFTLCDSYYAAIRQANPSQMEAIDMGRRALHNEGSEILTERLAGKVVLDLDTARRLFTLICALHFRV